jgi:two-component system sensor histidine kinase/response regulator
MENEEFKVLIVDDLPKNIMVLGNNLMNENYQIAYARSGLEAIKLTENNDFDLILLDIMMPGMDGYETCKRILSNPKTAHIPIIFITAKNDFDSIVKGFKAGAKDFITKPFNSFELLARVQTHLELKRNREKLEILNRDLEYKVAERTAQLRNANEKLKNLDLAKSSFLGIISHEIRTPLNGIYGSVEMLSDLYKDEETNDIIQMISESADRLMTFSELSTLITELNIDHYQLNKDQVNVVELVKLVSQEKIINLESYQDVEIIFSQKDEEHLIEADKKLIKKIINDVIGNSIKFAEEKITIDINIVPKEEGICLYIHDNGNGFPDNVLLNAVE